MKDMKKDEKIEACFREYFQGNGAPACDLTQAKRASEEEAHARKKRTGQRIKLASALACFALAASLCIVFLPSVFGGAESGNEGAAPPPADIGGQKTVYSLSETTSRASDYWEMKESYALQTEMLFPFEWADNASCAFTLYEYKGTSVLVRADLRYGGMRKFDASVYIDLTGGRFETEEFGELRAYEYGQIKTEYLNGEYVSSAYCMRGSTEYLITEVTSPQEDSAEYLVDLIQK